MEYVVLHFWSQIPFLYTMRFPRFVFPRFFVYYELSAWVCERCLFEIRTLLQCHLCWDFGCDISVLNRFNVIWACLRKHWEKFPAPDFPQWSDSSTCGWLSPLNLSYACVGETIGMLLIVFCQNILVPVKIHCPANVLLVWIHCCLIHHAIFTRRVEIIFMSCP